LSGFLVSGRDASELFELCEATFDKVSLFVEFLVEGKFCRSGRIVRDHRDAAGFGDAVAEVIGIIGCIGHDDAGLLSLQQRCRLGSIALLTGSQTEGDRTSQAAYSEMDLGA
jgi:hypothetical protein